MRHLLKLLLPALVLLPLVLSPGGCTCGFDCSSDDDEPEGNTLLSLGFSDALPEELKEVVITVDSIILRPSKGEDIKIDQFTIDQLGLVDSPTFTMDLLDYRGINQLPVFEDLEIEPGFYSEIIIAFLANDVNYSYVIEDDDTLKEITVSGGSLALSGKQIAAGLQAYTVEFGLAQALQYRAATGKYALTTDGVRLENSNLAAALSGQIDEDLFDTVSPCDEKDDPEAGNRVYLYQGKDLNSSNLADVFTDDSATSAPSSAIAPFAVAALSQFELTGNWEYAFGYLPSGDYTIAFACDTEEDNNIEYDGLSIPLPTEQIYEINLSESERAQCNLEAEASCE